MGEVGGASLVDTATVFFEPLCLFLVGLHELFAFLVYLFFALLLTAAHRLLLQVVKLHQVLDGLLWLLRSRIGVEHLDPLALHACF